MDDRLLRQSEVKELIGLADSTLEQWRLRGRGPKFIKMGRLVRYRLSDVRAYLAGFKAYGSTIESAQDKGPSRDCACKGC